MSKVQQVVYWSSLKDLKIRKHHPKCIKKVYGYTSKKVCGLYRAECMQALQAGVRKLILDIMYFLFAKILLWDFLCIIIRINKIQTLLALLEFFIAVVFENISVSTLMQAILLTLFPRTIPLISIIISLDWLLFIPRKSYWFHWGSIRLWTFTDAGLYSWQLLMDLSHSPLVSALHKAFLSRPMSSIRVSPRSLHPTR